MKALATDVYIVVKDIWIEGLTVPQMIHKAESVLDAHK